MRLLLLCWRVACQNVPTTTPTLHQIVALAAKVSANVSSLLAMPWFGPRLASDVTPSACSDWDMAVGPTQQNNASIELHVRDGVGLLRPLLQRLQFAQEALRQFLKGHVTARAKQQLKIPGPACL